MSQRNLFLKISIPLIIIIAGAAAMYGLKYSRTEPKKEIRTDPGILVRTARAVKKDVTVMVKGTGTVEASQEISVIPQVSGSVVYVSPNLVVGGRFRKGEVLFRIEDIDYVLGLEQAKAARATAEYELAKIESSAEIARSEWERLKLDDAAEASPLVLYEPQLANARAALTSASASVEQAKLALDRTSVKAPINAIVKSENIDIGQYVKSGSSVAVLTGTDTGEINIPLRSEDLYWLDVPVHGRNRDVPEAVVSVTVGGRTFEWQGHVLRTTGEVDPKSRMMQVVVEVDDPYGVQGNNHTGRPVLAIGTFVHVDIKGSLLKDVFVIPRSAFRDNATVWVMGKDDKLRIQDVTPVRFEKDTVIISRGLNDGDRIVLTNISGAADGMRLRAMEDKK